MFTHCTTLKMNAKQVIINIFISVTIILSFIGCSDTDNPFNPQDWDLEAEAAEIPWDKLTGTLLYIKPHEHNNNSYALLFLADADIRTVRLLKSRKEPSFGSLSIHPDRSCAVYGSYDFDSRSYYSIRKISLETGNEEIIYPTGTDNRHQNYPVYASDGKLVWLVNGEYNGSYHGFGLFVDGQPFMWIGLGLDQPCWSPDARYIVASPGEGLMYRFDYDAVTSDILIQEQYNPDELRIFFGDPAYSPDGKLLAYTRTIYDMTTFESLSELWVADSDGQNRRRVTTGNPDWSYDHTTWAADNRHVSVIRYIANTGSELLLVDTETGEETRVKWNAFLYGWQP